MYAVWTINMWWSKETPHHGKSSNLTDSQVKPAEVQRLLPDSRQVGDGRPPLIHEGQVAVHPQLSLRLRAQVVQAANLLIGHGGHAGLLQRRRHGDGGQLSSVRGPR